MSSFFRAKGFQPALQTAVEDNGLIGAWLLDGTGRAREIGWAEVRGWTPEQGALWLHLNRGAATVKTYMMQEAGLEPEVAEALLAPDVRPRVVPTTKGLLINLRGINFNPGADPEDMVALRVLLEGARLITTRQRRVMAIDDIRGRLMQGTGPKDTTDAFLAIAHALMLRIGQVLEELEDETDALEDELLADRAERLRDRLGLVRRRAVKIRRHLAPQREALNRLFVETTALIDERDRLVLRELADTTTRYVEDLDSVRDRAAVLQEEWGNRLAEAQNRNSYLLAVVAGMVLPLSLVTAVLGVNIGGMHEGAAGEAFWLLVAALCGLAVLQFVLYRVMRWL